MCLPGIFGQPAPMIGGKADKTHDWIDTWKSMEELYKKYPEKLKAIGKSLVYLYLSE